MAGYVHLRTVWSCRESHAAVSAGQPFDVATRHAVCRVVDTDYETFHYASMDVQKDNLYTVARRGKVVA